LRKTRLCQAFEQGNCTNKDCTFAHGEEELRSTNLFYKKSLCIWNQKGKCRNGNQCRFAHGSAELRTSQGSPGSNGGNSPAPSPANQGAPSGPKGAKFLKEPMKVQPASCLPPPQTGIPAEDTEQAHSLPLDIAATGLPYPTDASLGGAYDAAWWQWPVGYSMTVPGMMTGPPRASVDDLKADLERIRQSITHKDIGSDLERLREDVVSLTQKCNDIQMQIGTASGANPFMKAAPGLDMDPIDAGYFEAEGNMPLPTFWA